MSASEQSTERAHTDLRDDERVVKHVMDSMRTAVTQRTTGGGEWAGIHDGILQPLAMAAMGAMQSIPSRLLADCAAPSESDLDPWCREEPCRYRHWRSGPMPTHRRGSECPTPAPTEGEQA
jgi:hypothetical protein